MLCIKPSRRKNTASRWYASQGLDIDTQMMMSMSSHFYALMTIGVE